MTAPAFGSVEWMSYESLLREDTKATRPRRAVGQDVERLIGIGPRGTARARLCEWARDRTTGAAVAYRAPEGVDLEDVDADIEDYVEEGWL